MISSITVHITESVRAQSVNLFTSRQQWDFALDGDTPEFCVDFTTNANSDFSQGNGPVILSDMANVQRFSLNAIGPRDDQNLVSATEDAAILFVEKGSLGDPTFVDLDLTVGSSLAPVLAWGGEIALGSQQNELVTLELTTASGQVSQTFPIVADGFIGFTVQTGGGLSKIRFVATNDDTGAGGEIFTLDNVCGSTTLEVIPTAAPIAPTFPTFPTPTPSGNDKKCFLKGIPILGDIFCFFFGLFF